MHESPSENFQNLRKLLGLSNKEAEVYKGLLEYPAGVSVAILSDKTKMPRGTLYGILDTMVSRGTIQLSSNNGKHYRPTPLDELENLIKTRVSQAQDELENFKKSKQAFSELVDKPTIHPRFTYNQGEIGLVQTYFSALQTKEKFIRAIFPERSVLEKLGRKTVEEFKKNRLGRGISVHTLVSRENKIAHSVLESSKKNIMEIRQLPDNYMFPASILIFDSTVLFFTTETETVSARIESKEFSLTMKSLFDTIWEKQK